MESGGRGVLPLPANWAKPGTTHKKKINKANSFNLMLHLQKSLEFRVKKLELKNIKKLRLQDSPPKVPACHPSGRYLPPAEKFKVQS
jgi:hypothetical protein